MSRDDCGDCADLGEQLDQCEADAEEFCLRIAALEAEAAQLRRWKAEAIEVLAAWDEVADLIPMVPGESKAAAVKSWAEMFKAGEAP